MQRKAYAQGFAAVTAVLLALTGCTGSDDDTAAVGSEAGGSATSATPAPSGKYRTLPEPCTAMSRSTLDELLPGAADESEEDAELALAGEASLTYDTDRRSGCGWRREDDDGGHGLQLDFERIVSYDAEVSDEEQARQLYVERAGELDVDLESSQPDVPDKSDTTPESGPSVPVEGSGSDEADGDDAADGEDGEVVDDDEESVPAAETIAPRVLDDIGDESFLDDRLEGDKDTRREVTVVFRTSNVIVTVAYNQWFADEQAAPDSTELQERTQEVAESLAGLLSE